MLRGPIHAGACALATATLVAGGCAFAAAGSAAGASPGPARAAAAPSTDLGGPNYEGYCRQLGYARSEVAPSKEWACVHSDGTTSPLNVQAACEFSFTQRPVAALQLEPGVPFTWQCWAAQPGKVVLPEGAGEGAGSGGSSPLAVAVRRALVPVGRGAKIGQLLRRGRYATSFRAPGLAQLTLSWYFQPRHGRRTLLATATAMFSGAGSRSIALVLTSNGKRLLKHASRLTVSGRGSYIPNASNPVGAGASFTLRR